jgi:hypothetical protein
MDYVFAGKSSCCPHCADAFSQRRLFHITGGYLPVLQGSAVMTVRAPKNVTIPLLAFNAAR